MQPSGSFEAALQRLTDEQLLDQLGASDTPELLQAEVRRRLQLRADYELRAQQHAEISRMVEHLEQSRVDWQAVREFFRESLLEFTTRPEESDDSAH